MVPPAEFRLALKLHACPLPGCSYFYFYYYCCYFYYYCCYYYYYYHYYFIQDPSQPSIQLLRPKGFRSCANARPELLLLLSLLVVGKIVVERNSST